MRDPDRAFDPWNAIYGSDDYKALLEDLDALGEPRTLVTEIWYPVEPPPGCRRLRRRPAERCSPAGARRATYLDYYAGDRRIFDRRGVPPHLVTASGETVAALEARDPQAHAQLVDEVLDELAARQRNSFVDAAPARGEFPLVVLSHGGFGGNVASDSHREVWTTAAEHLASHGYVVAAPSHTGDSRLPTVFHHADSELRRAGGQAAADAAYDVLFGERTIPEKITARIFQPGGFALANTMMQRLFEMRVDDVVSVIEAVRELDAQRGDLLSGRVDLERIGVAGFSLGSMTAQIAMSSLEVLTTGMSWNNGLPHAWEPDRFDGLERPHFFSLSTEDQLSRTFFTNIPFLVYPNAVPGGEPADFLQLEGERFFPPTRENPEPVVRTAYDRAAGPKMLLSLIDARHWDVTDDDDYLYPRHRLARGETHVAFDNRLRRLPFGEDVLDPSFVGAPFETLSWRRTPGGVWRYVPHEIRDHYAAAWFGLFLKGEESYRHHLRHDPFGGDARVRSRRVAHR